MLINEKYVNKDGQEINFIFDNKVSLKNKVKIVSSVIESIIDDTIFYSFMKEIYIDYFLIYYLTDIEFDEELIGDMNYIEEMVNSGIAEIIKNNIDKSSLEDIYHTIDDNIQFRTGIKRNNVENKICDLIDNINSQIKDIDLTEMLSISEKLADVVFSKEFNVGNITKALIESEEIDKRVKEREENKH